MLIPVKEHIKLRIGNLSHSGILDQAFKFSVSWSMPAENISERFYNPESREADEDQNNLRGHKDITSVSGFPPVALIRCLPSGTGFN